MSDVVVRGVGMHAFGRFDDESVIDLGVAAVLEALRDADLDWSHVEALYCGHMYAKTGAGQRIMNRLGLSGIPVINVENACSSGGLAVQLAHQAIASGSYGTVMALGVEKMPRGVMDMDYFEPWRQRAGHAVNPAQFALAARRMMHDSGVTETHLAQVAVKNHLHSVDNDRAMYRRKVTLEEVMDSRMVVDPLRLLMLCSPNEGAAAAILQSQPSRPGDVVLAGYGLRTATRDQAIGEHMPLFSPVERAHGSVTRRASEAAYAMAGLGPDDVDLAEVQDTDSGSEILATEELGLCARGEGGFLVESGASTIGGRIPVNPSGGLLSKGEPVGASALGQVFEVVNQLRGRAGSRQVEGARVGLTHALGAGGNCSVLLFRRV